mmetsp:Transcript_101287/g.285577  ORF Transcript_101287/g.285577 Transcript_101287/m.285577 type:complete len:211 (+) Transcript_101287:90-722(+)
MPMWPVCSASGGGYYLHPLGKPPEHAVHHAFSENLLVGFLELPVRVTADLCHSFAFFWRAEHVPRFFLDLLQIDHGHEAVAFCNSTRDCCKLFVSHSLVGAHVRPFARHVAVVQEPSLELSLTVVVVRHHGLLAHLSSDLFPQSVQRECGRVLNLVLWNASRRARLREKLGLFDTAREIVCKLWQLLLLNLMARHRDEHALAAKASGAAP